MKNDRILKHMGTITSTFSLGAAYGLLLSLAPVALIHHRHLASFLTEQDFPKLCFYVLSLLTAGMSAVILSDKSSPQLKETERSTLSLQAKRLGTLAKAQSFEILATTAVFLFTACAALCQKLGICPLPGFGLVNPPWPALGLILVSLAMICQFASIRTTATSIQQNHKPAIKHLGWCWRLSEPVSLAWIVLLSGVSLLFSTWFPLIALPGIFIGMKWKLNAEIEKQAVAREPNFEPTETSS